MRKLVVAVVALALSATVLAQPLRARNVILFLADAGGIPTLNAASTYGYGAGRKLFVQQMPHIALSNTAAALEMVTDSAAGMTAIVTGQRTNNGVLAESAAAVHGQRDGEPLKTILEYAEERGLATGFVTNDSIAGATPAALYAKVNDRDATGQIILQLFKPRFGDGPDVVIGAGRDVIPSAVSALGQDLEALSREAKRPLVSRVEDVPAGARRFTVLLDTGDFDEGLAVKKAIATLSRSRSGYFLMVECDVHTDRLKQGLERMVAFDRLIREVAKAAPADTLILFTADHSFDVRVVDGNWGQPLLTGFATGDESQQSLRLPYVRMDNSHTGEEVLVAAQGPGAERVHGVMANTDLFSVMMRAYGWRATPTTPPPPRTTSQATK
jgi:alkaline phosphatase